MSDFRTGTIELDGRPEDAPARTAYRAVVVVFMAHAMLFASWAAHIPQVVTELGLSDGELGTALLGAPIGSVAAMVISRWLLPRLGSKLLTQITAAGYTLAGISVGLATSLAQLFAALALWGLFQGGLDVAMNTQAVTIEKSLGSPIMSRLHGMWSVGGLLGALIGTAAVGVGMDLGPQLAVMGALALILVEGSSRHLLVDRSAPTSRARRTVSGSERERRYTSTVLVLGGVSFASMLCEGASVDWSAKLLRVDVGSSATVAGLGYVAFTVTMVVMRLSGTWLQSRFTARRLLSTLAVVSAVGMTPALLIAHPVTGLIGFAAMGFGVALVVPTAFSAAGEITRDSANAGASIATVAALGWVGFVSGPPLIGHLGDAVGLRSALVVLPVAAMAIAVAIGISGAFGDLGGGASGARRTRETVGDQASADAFVPGNQRRRPNDSKPTT